MTASAAARSSTVLLVEDDVDIQEMVSLILDARGYRTVLAANGLRALEVLRREAGTVDLILLDMMMPVMDGTEFRAEQLREPALASVPVVILTGDGHAREKAARIGAVGYLTKPPDVDDLLAIVERHLPRRVA